MIIIVNEVEYIFTEPCRGMWGQSENCVYSIQVVYPTQLISKYKLIILVSYSSEKELLFLLHASIIDEHYGIYGDSFLLTFPFKSPTCNVIHGVAFLAADIMGFVNCAHIPGDNL